MKNLKTKALIILVVILVCLAVILQKKYIALSKLFGGHRSK
jgi:preprotein translocase subunit SecG